MLQTFVAVLQMGVANGRKIFRPYAGVPFGIFRVGICHILDKRNNNPSTINAVGAKKFLPSLLQ